jgi:recombination protein RecA
MVADECVDMIQSGMDLIIIDSVSALIPRIFFDDGDIKDFENTGQIGAFSKDVGTLVKMLNGVNEKCMIVFISQQRNAIGKMFTKMKPMGGEALSFYSSTVLKFWSSESDAKSIKAKVKVGDKLIETNIGRTVNWEVEFNKLGPMSQTGVYDFYYIGDQVGVDKCSELLTYGEMYGVIQKGGSWYTFSNGERHQGGKAAANYLRDNPDIFEMVWGELRDKTERSDSE